LFGERWGGRFGDIVAIIHFHCFEISALFFIMAELLQ
jgi:hypothetical protein